MFINVFRAHLQTNTIRLTLAKIINYQGFKMFKVEETQPKFKGCFRVFVVKIV